MENSHNINKCSKFLKTVQIFVFSMTFLNEYVYSAKRMTLNKIEGKNIYNFTKDLNFLFIK